MIAFPPPHSQGHYYDLGWHNAPCNKIKYSPSSSSSSESDEDKQEPISTELFDDLSQYCATKELFELTHSINFRPNDFELALEFGANLTFCDENGMTPLHWAAINKNKRAYNKMVSLGANEQLKDKAGFLAREYFWSNKEAIQIQVELFDLCSSALPDISAISYFANCLYKNQLINSRDQDGLTALHRAAYVGNVEAVAILLNLGINKLIKTKLGLTALEIAQQSKHLPVANIYQSPYINHFDDCIQLLTNDCPSIHL